MAIHVEALAGELKSSAKESATEIARLRTLLFECEMKDALNESFSLKTPETPEEVGGARSMEGGNDPATGGVSALPIPTPPPTALATPTSTSTGGLFPSISASHISVANVRSRSDTRPSSRSHMRELTSGTGDIDTG